MGEAETPHNSPEADPGLDHAWNWFQYHAAQRLTAFNFFLVLVGFLLVTYAQAVHYGWTQVGCAIGILGALVALAFWALDVRNEELILCGWTALSTMSDQASADIVTGSDNRTHLKAALGRSPLGVGLFGLGMNGQSRRVKLFRHRTWLRLIMGSVGIAFVVGAVWSFEGFPGASVRVPATHQTSAHRRAGSPNTPPATVAPTGSDQK